MDYGKTLNLPKTAFPMKANLPVKELDIIKKWEEIDVYNKIIEKNKDCKSFVMHDGPPYANGNLHDGHILNKILKDITVKYKNMTGHLATFLPGWDCHGLPIELKVSEKLGSKKHDMPKTEFLKRCRDYAENVVKTQREEFKRIGVIADWENPYKTLSPEYESKIAHQFANIIESGALYKSKKPVYWCAKCGTALADSEVEYHDHKSPSIYVKFPVKDNISELEGESVNFVIWTTTPWTIPANLAICLNPQLEYAALKFRDEVFIVALELKETFLKAIGEEHAEQLHVFKADRFEGMKTQHPFMDRESIIAYGDHVTLEAGTGCVHTAPGHGQEDYIVGLEYGLEPYAPVDNAGRFTDDVQLWAGQPTHKANKHIVQHLFDTGHLLNKPGEEVEHSYPCHDRCGTPIIFRATEQWFISMDETELREKALAELEHVEMIPAWGRNRITAMIQNAPHWCISRQRLWGVPIIAFECVDCGEKIVDAEIAHNVADMFAEYNIDIWYEKESAFFLPEGYSCPKCSSKNIQKENDILDVWFDSGVSWAAVLTGKKGLEFPADLYLEGSDQHRGWFQSSLKLSTLITGKAPYRKVLTHGFVVDGKGEKLSKSKKNFTPPEKRMKQMGAEISRLWVSAEDYRDDIRISDDIMKNFSIAYRKIRNTIRFMFGFINDFDYTQHTYPETELKSVDKWALLTWKKKLKTILSKYETFEFHRIMHELLDFMTVDLSSFYLDIIKDRYVMKADDSRRRMSQFTTYTILSDIITVLAPVLSFTAEEAYGYLPKADKKDSVFLENMPEREFTEDEMQFLEKWDALLKARTGIQKQLENLRADKIIGHSLDSSVTLYWKDIPALDEERENLESILIVSEVEIVDSPENLTRLDEDVEAYGAVSTATGDKCPRCWKIKELKDYSDEITGICETCYEVIK